jgi:pyruvate dehydrogenase E2 component (dihydrolipoamide acetyltransferase)
MAIPVLMPSLSPTMEKGVVTRWIKRAGDFVEAGDLIAEIATDMATMDVESPSTGVLAQILVAAGSADVPVNDQIAWIEPQDEAPPEPAPRMKKPASPRARRLARETGVDIATLNGGGPYGRVIERDVLAALAAEGRQSPDHGTKQPVESAPLAWARPGALACLEIDCEMDALLDLLAKLGEAEALQAGATPKISIEDAIVKALALALRRASAPPGDIAFGDVNGKTTVLRRTESLTLTQLAAARAESRLGEAEGAACLILHLGAYGVKRFSCVPDGPFASLLALGAVEKRLVVKAEAPAVATIMSVTLTQDDPSVGARLLHEFKRLLEQPYVMLL